MTAGKRRGGGLSEPLVERKLTAMEEEAAGREGSGYTEGSSPDAKRMRTRSYRTTLRKSPVPSQRAPIGACPEPETLNPYPETRNPKPET